MHTLRIFLQQEWAFADLPYIQKTITPHLSRIAAASIDHPVAFFPEQSSIASQHGLWLQDIPCTVIDSSTVVRIAWFPSHQTYVPQQKIALFDPCPGTATVQAVQAITRPAFLAHALCDLLRSSIEQFPYATFVDLAWLLPHEHSTVPLPLLRETVQKRVEIVSPNTYNVWLYPDTPTQTLLQRHYQAYCRKVGIHNPPPFSALLERVQQWSAPLLTALREPGEPPTTHPGRR